MKYLWILLAAVALLSACNKTENKIAHKVIFKKFNEQPVEVINTTFEEGFVCGVSFERNEVYVQSIFPINRNHLINIIDINTGTTKKKVELPTGDFQGPGKFSNPSYIQYLGRGYYVVDQFHKIVVYDEHFKYLFTSMFKENRRSIDFFSVNNETFFCIETKLTGRKATVDRISCCREMSSPAFFELCVSFFIAFAIPSCIGPSNFGYVIFAR